MWLAMELLELLRKLLHDASLHKWYDTLINRFETKNIRYFSQPTQPPLHARRYRRLLHLALRRGPRTHILIHIHTLPAPDCLEPAYTHCTLRREYP